MKQNVLVLFSPNIGGPILRFVRTGAAFFSTQAMTRNTKGKPKR